MRLTLLVVVALALLAAGCSARDEGPAVPGWTVAEAPPVERFDTCSEMWEAGWKEGVRVWGSVGEMYPPEWSDAQTRAYRLNRHLAGSRGEACQRRQLHGARLGYEHTNKSRGASGARPRTTTGSSGP